MPPCLPSSIGSSSILYTTASSSNITYNCYTYNWTASTTGSVTLSFVMRHDPDYWYLDDVAVYYYGTNMIVNGGFETGSLAPWVRSTPNGPCTRGAPAAVRMLRPFTGTYALSDGSNGCTYQISQSFVVTAGQDFIVSFWLRSGSLGAVVSANVTLFWPVFFWIFLSWQINIRIVNETRWPERSKCKCVDISMFSFSSAHANSLPAWHSDVCSFGAVNEEERRQGRCDQCVWNASWNPFDCGDQFQCDHDIWTWLSHEIPIKILCWGSLSLFLIIVCFTWGNSARQHQK